MLNKRWLGILLACFCLSGLMVPGLNTEEKKKEEDKAKTLSPEIEKKLSDNLGKVAHPYLTGTTEEERQLILKEVFDLKNPDVTRFLIQLIGVQTNVAGPKLEQALMLTDFFLDKGVEGLLWLLENYDEFTAIGRRNMIFYIELFECNESYQVVYYFLNDKTEVILKSMEGRRDLHERICDDAYAYLSTRCYDVMSEELWNKTCMPFYKESIEERDRRINTFISWLDSPEGKKFLKTKKSILDTDKAIDEKPEQEKGKIKAELRQRLHNELNKLKGKIEKGQKPKESPGDKEKEDKKNHDKSKDSPDKSGRDDNKPSDSDKTPDKK